MDNYVKVKRVLWIIFFANILVAVLKIVIGGMIKSTSLSADGFHSLSDGSSNIVGLIGICIASKPVDKMHPYGHKKVETLTGLFIGGMLLLIGGKIVFSVVNRFTNPIIPSISLESIIIILATLGINFFVSKYEFKKGKKLGSYILISDSLHTKSDVYISIGVLVTLIGIKLGLPPIIDPIASLVVAVFIFIASYQIFKSAFNVLLDGAVVDVCKVNDVVLSFNEVKSVHRIRSRGTENDIYIDMHIMLEPDTKIEQSHALIHNIENRLKEEINQNIQIIVHVEPFYKIQI